MQKYRVEMNNKTKRYPEWLGCAVAEGENRITLKERLNAMNNFTKISILSLMIIAFSLEGCSFDESNRSEEIIQTGKVTYVKRTYYKNSSNIVSEVGYINDSILNGVYRIYSSSRDILYDGEYTLGKADGVFRWYYGYKNDYSLWNSKYYNFIEHEGVFRNDKKVGQWKYFYPNGFIKGIVTYDSLSNVISNYHFDSNGNLLHHSGSSATSRIPSRDVEN